MNTSSSPRPGVSVVLLTLDESCNLPHALDSVCGWADQVFVLDSFSSDDTVEIARARGCHVAQHRFVDYASQRNHALDHLPIETEWVLFLDADEWLPTALRDEISRVVRASPPENGFMLCRRLLWRGRWIKRGYYPTWILRLFRHGKARCELRAVNEHLLVDGAVGHLTEDFMHEDRKPLEVWLRKHIGYARREAIELVKEQSAEQLDARLLGSQPERVRWIRQNVWSRLPLLTRPWMYFGYRYVARRGFLEGPEALAFHTLHALWFQTLIDLHVMELREAQGKPPR